MELREDLGPLRRRGAALTLLVLTALGLIHARLAMLQLVQGGRYRAMAEDNRVRQVPVEAPRGRIYDRRGALLADNVPTWRLLLFPDEVRDVDATLLFLAQARIADLATLRERMQLPRWGQMAPVVMGEDLTWSQVARIRAHQADHPELSVLAGSRRHYPNGALTAHAIGYLRLPTLAELAGDPLLRPAVLVGATGVEAQGETLLAGVDGDRWVVSSAVGQQLGVVRETPSRAGSDLTLTLDLELQAAAARALGEEAGAVVVLDPRTGAVRALYSAPSFDANRFVGRLSTEDWAVLRDDPGKPLQNRCTQGTYPPGSTIKPFLALAASSDGAVPDGWGVRCAGEVVLHGHPFRCWQRAGHGWVGLERSLEVSCDVYYYQLGQRLGIDGIAAWLDRFGFGHETGIGIGSESAGLVGTPEWSRRVRGQPWYPGTTVSVSIGQGPVVSTALQLARAYAALANGGFLVTPHLVAGSVPEPPANLGLDRNRLAEVVAGLRDAIHGPEGTARVLAPLPVAGKTGTAQVIRLQDGVRVEQMEHHLRHHAWFVGWAPLDRPQWVVAVLVEHGGGGGGVAAPAAGWIFRTALAAGVDPVPVESGHGPPD